MVTLQDRVELVRSESERLQSYLQTLPKDAWDRPSACDPWTVADVVGHLVWWLIFMAMESLVASMVIRRHQKVLLFLGHWMARPSTILFPSGPLLSGASWGTSFWPRLNNGFTGLTTCWQALGRRTGSNPVTTSTVFGRPRSLSL
ncbi:MAG: maleylpyruvate isomerase N-terminal domain-containing protein [Chloroflexi bacterium]|nr:maleylpyruvate isomerase N-terminal domain-containing protein [Chloroflexota bacterium]